VTLCSVLGITPVLVLLATKKHRTPSPVDVPGFASGGSADVPWGFLLILVGGVTAVGLVAYLSYLSTKKRRLGFRTMATQLGLDYSLHDPFGVLGWPFALFRKGDGQGVENVLSGVWQGLEVSAFDFWYFEESTDSNGHRSRSYYRFDCAVVPIDAACPRLAIDHETFLTRLAGAMSFHDIEFEDEAFNRAFNVHADDRKFANDVVDARMMSWLQTNASDFAFEIVGNRVLVAGPKIQPTEIVQVIGTAKAFVDHVPKVVFSLYPVSG
jgi:hypothetical protein